MQHCIFSTFTVVKCLANIRITDKNKSMNKNVFFAVILLFVMNQVTAQKPLPQKLAILTFDDAVESHYSVVAPLLKEYGFGATFFICEYPGVFENKEQSMTWEQIKELNDMGFEIGNHTRTHKHLTKMKRVEELTNELEYIEQKCTEYDIPQPVSFAYPAYKTSSMGFDVLRRKGYKFARVGGGNLFSLDSVDFLAIPSVSTSLDSRERVNKALSMVKENRIVVFTIHGVPDMAHPHVNTTPELFKEYLETMKKEGFTVISLRDLAQYLEPNDSPFMSNDLDGDLFVHDPVMIKENGRYYVFSTGPGISIKTSDDGKVWHKAGSVFKKDSLPQWHRSDIPEQDGHLWAPDIHYRNGLYHLYYSVSAWMNFNSSIGYATNVTLDVNSPDYKWIDRGKVVDFRNGGEGVNVIDPNVFVETNGTPWLLYGSYKSGLRMSQLDENTGYLKDSSNVDRITLTTSLGEGVFLLKDKDFYYIFASRGKCCSGAESTYNVVMGRSKSLEGPYLDKSGRSWVENYSSQLMLGDDKEPGRGHNGFFYEDGVTYIVYHAYTMSKGGASMLNIKPLYVGSDGWPTLEKTDILFRQNLAPER